MKKDISVDRSLNNRDVKWLHGEGHEALKAFAEDKSESMRDIQKRLGAGFGTFNEARDRLLGWKLIALANKADWTRGQSKRYAVTENGKAVLDYLQKTPLTDVEASRKKLEPMLFAELAAPRPLDGAELWIEMVREYDPGDEDLIYQRLLGLSEFIRNQRDAENLDWSLGRDLKESMVKLPGLDMSRDLKALGLRSVQKMILDAKDRVRWSESYPELEKSLLDLLKEGDQASIEALLTFKALFSYGAIRNDVFQAVIEINRRSMWKNQQRPIELTWYSIEVLRQWAPLFSSDQQEVLRTQSKMITRCPNNTYWAALDERDGTRETQLDLSRARDFKAFVASL